MNFIVFIIIASSYTVLCSSECESEENYITVLNEDLEKNSEEIETFVYRKDETTTTKPYIPNNILKNNSFGLMTVFPPDTRVKQSTSVFPYSSICSITAYYNNNSSFSRGTGFLVDDNVLLTAAHIAKGAERIEVIPGRDGEKNMPYGMTWAKNIVTPNAYVNQAEYDWAIVKLQDRIGSNTGWSGVERFEDYSVLTGENLWTSGYPYDKGNYYQYRAGGSVTATYEQVFFHNADIASGMSGGPFTRLKTGYVVGIQSQENDNTNFACRIYNDLFYLICNIINED